METLKEGVKMLYSICPACDGEYKWEAKGGWKETCPNCGCQVQGVSERAYMITKNAARLSSFFCSGG